LFVEEYQEILLSLIYVTLKMPDYRKYTDWDWFTAVVESVRDGGTLRLMLVPTMNYITLMLTGIRCPSFKPDGGSEDHADEVRLTFLHLEIKKLLFTYSQNL